MRFPAKKSQRRGYRLLMAKAKAAGNKKYWSAHVTETSDAMDIAGGTFAKDDPKAIAHELERDAEKSNRRKSSPYRSAMSMLTFYINRAGKNLPAARRKILEDAKAVLREEFGPPSATGTRKKPAAKKTPAGARKKKTAVRKKTAARKKTTARR
ncbi:MAG TPA: DUF3175 domain-containing protein [Candidatus Elarobacter sp.]|nr:DUF3175 domain-containing protein [Candidatus Elarobacter sp.]